MTNTGLMHHTCPQCSAEFEVTADDLEFYDRISPTFNQKKYPVPPPTLCPQCRYQRRLCFRNERTLYQRKCDLTGKPMVSMHPAEVPFPVYHITQWMSDKWDPLEYGREFDFERPFFEQFSELCNSIPHFSAFVDPHMDVNSEYTNCSSEAKNCYLISQAERNEDCYYSRGLNNCKSCCDCYRVTKCELCYEGIDLNNCYHCFYSQDCENCADCHFSTDLRGCKNCFGCHGLISKEYYLFNEPMSKAEWQDKVDNLKYKPEVIEHMREQSAAARLKQPQRAVRLIQCENCVGDHLSNCRDSKYVFDCNNLEHCAYCNEIANDAKDCYDYCMWGINCELLYECNGCGYNVYNTLFSNHCWQNISNLLYCESCFPAVKNCFGCFGLRSSEHCILNKQYSAAEYEVMVGKIIDSMISTGEWGEFFPSQLAPYAYNESLAQLFFPLTKAEVLAKGWAWREDDETVGATASDGNVRHCKETGKPYRLIAQEQEFYRQMGLPEPDLCPETRHTKRHQKRPPRWLWPRQCAKNGEDMLSIYQVERPEVVYCEKCYLGEVY